MPDAEVKILGLSRFRTTMRRAGMDMADMKEANIRAARTVADRAQAIGPNRTGRLVGSLRTPRTAAKAVVRSNLVYAPVIHYGWPRRHIRPQPFLPVAAAQTRDTWLAAYEKDLQHLLDQVEGM